MLREQIAAHLAATRGLVADPGCIVVTGGTQQALRTAADLLLDPGDSVWVEDPGYIAGRGALLAAGAEIVPIPERLEGIDVAAGDADRAARAAWRWSRRRMPRRWAALCRSAAGWRCWNGRRGPGLGTGGRLRLGIPLGGQTTAPAGDAWIRPGR